MHWLSHTVQMQQQFSNSQYWQQPQYRAREQRQMQQCVHMRRGGVLEPRTRRKMTHMTQPRSQQAQSGHLVAAQHTQQAAALSVVTLVERRGAHDA
jgi:hypothetical protein